MARKGIEKILSLQQQRRPFPLSSVFIFRLWFGWMAIAVLCTADGRLCRVVFSVGPVQRGGGQGQRLRGRHPQELHERDLTQNVKMSSIWEHYFNL